MGKFEGNCVDGLRRRGENSPKNGMLFMDTHSHRNMSTSKPTTNPKNTRSNSVLIFVL
jgi:hypothetical protein